MNTKNLFTVLKYAAVAGNITFILWGSFNAMDEGFKGSIAEKLSYFGLAGLLTVNSTLLLTKSQNSSLATLQEIN